MIGYCFFFACFCVIPSKREYRCSKSARNINSVMIANTQSMN